MPAPSVGEGRRDTAKSFDSLDVVQIKVLFFGLLKDICGFAEDRIELPAGSTAGAVFEHYAAVFPKLRQMASSIVLARNHEFATTREPLADGDEVALLPPGQRREVPFRNLRSRKAIFSL